jgi:N-acetylmuramic acid 6-phosphate etherase
MSTRTTAAVRTPKAPTIPDRAGIATEQRNPRSMRLHAMSVSECVRLINEEDSRVIEALNAAGPAITALISEIEPRFCRASKPGRLIYLGAGTSGRLGVLDASEAPPTFQVSSDRIIGIIAGGDRALRISSEGKEDDPEGSLAALESLKLTKLDCVIGIAAGGTTPYATGALRVAKRLNRGVLTALLTCSPVPRPAACDHLIVLNTGPEVLTGSTRMKAGTATKLALNTISTTLMVRSGRVYENLMVDLRASNDKLRDRAARIISTLTDASRDEALALLGQSGGDAKTAVVMRRLSVSRDEAAARLARASGVLGNVLDRGTAGGGATSSTRRSRPGRPAKKRGSSARTSSR